MEGNLWVHLKWLLRPFLALRLAYLVTLTFLPTNDDSLGMKSSSNWFVSRPFGELYITLPKVRNIPEQSVLQYLSKISQYRESELFLVYYNIIL